MGIANPALKTEVFAKSRYDVRVGEQLMSIEGTVNKTGFLLVLLTLSAGWVWYNTIPHIMDAGSTATLGVQAGSSPMPWMIGGGIVGFILAVVISFKNQWAQYLAPAYCICEGLLIGGLSAMMELMYPGIALQATGLTFGTLFALLGAYKAGWIRVTEKFQSGMTIAIGGIAIVYLVSMVLGFFGIQMPLIHSSGPMGIAFSVVVVGVAALSLLLDFEFIVQGSRLGAPKHMEWYGAFGLIVTLVWLYIEILNLLAKIQRRD